MAEVLNLRGEPMLADPEAMTPNQALEDAKISNLRQVVIIGEDQDGRVRVYGSHGTAETFWLLKHGELSMLSRAQD